MSLKIGITCKKNVRMENYTDAIVNFGGDPIIFASLEKSIPEHLASIPKYLEEIDGLLLPGGGDIDSTLFFQKRHPEVNNVSRSRDALELRLCQKALQANIPVFGICRGIQVMSVAMGGSLYQDIEAVYPREALNHKVDESGEDSRHPIEIKPYSRLSEIVNEHQTLVNSAHHQAVDEIGEEFVVTAYSEDGIIEAVENPSKRFVIGVQYHPERMLKKPELRRHAEKLFEAFIHAAKQR